MKTRQLYLAGVLLLGQTVFLGMPQPAKAAGPGGGWYGYLQHYGYITPNPYQSHPYYPALGGYPGYNPRPRYGRHFPSMHAGALHVEQPAPPSDARASIIVRVPAGAELWFNDKKTTREGTLRGFSTPVLTPRSTRSYEVRARWQIDGRTITKTRKVEVSAGASIELDFTADEITK